jgi:hypothetical protein
MSTVEGTRYLDGFCLSNADTVIKAWWQLGDDLLVRYNKLGYYDPANRTRSRSKPEYPEWWRKAIRIFDAIME